MEWIKCSERLPEVNQLVLMWVGCLKCGLLYKGRKHVHGETNLFYDPNLPKEPVTVGRYRNRVGNHWWDPVNPQYWMPLPQPPKDSNGMD
jgi:hypothetical protein